MANAYTQENSLYSHTEPTLVKSFPPFLKVRARDSSLKVETLQHALLHIDINQLFTQWLGSVP